MNVSDRTLFTMLSTCTVGAKYVYSGWYYYNRDIFKGNHHGHEGLIEGVQRNAAHRKRRDFRAEIRMINDFP